MEMTLLVRTDRSGHSECSSGPCPSLYETDRGTFVVQGYRLDADVQASMAMPGDETAIEVPAGFIQRLRELAG